MEQMKVLAILMKGFKLIIRLLITLVILSLLLIIYQSVKYPNQPPSFLGYVPYTVLSNSMNPSFETGDMVIVKKSNASDIHVNDVITFNNDSRRVITHRVIGMKKNHGQVNFVTKGDNNNVKDEQMPTGHQLIGKKVYMIPKAGYAAKFVGSPTGVFVFVLLPLVGFVCMEIYERVKKRTNSGQAEQPFQSK